MPRPRLTAAGLALLFYLAAPQLGEAAGVEEVDPDALVRLVAGLQEAGGTRRVLVDLTQRGTYRPVLEAAAESAEELGSVLVLLSCATHHSWCHQELRAWPWTALRLYTPGDEVTTTGHVDFPAGVLTPENAVRGGAGLGYIRDILAAGSRGEAQKLSQLWAGHLRDATEVVVGADGSSAAAGPMRVTAENLQAAMAPALDEDEGQAFLLYHGSYSSCAKQVAAVRGALDLLGRNLDPRFVTIGLVNCDVHHEPCESASRAGYCGANHFTRTNACPVNVGGPRGGAHYSGKFEPEAIAEAIRAKLPAGRGRLKIEL